MIVYGARPYTYILYDADSECDYLRLAATDWYMRPRTSVNWDQASMLLAMGLEEQFVSLGLPCGQ